MQILVDELIEEEWISSVGEITFEKDNEGRIYIQFDHGQSEIGVNLSDVLKFIQEKLVHP